LTARERNLLILFFVVLGAAGLLLALGSYWEELSRLDTEFVGLQKRVLHVAQTTASSQTLATASRWPGLDQRFFAAGTLPTPLALASEVQAALKTSGLEVVESRIVETTETGHWVQYMVQGRIGDWFRFLQGVRLQDAKVLFRTLSLMAKPGAIYAISFEAGHVVLP